MTFLSMVACQVGTAFAARTDRASLRSIGVFSNRLLLWGIAFELALTGLLIYVPVCQELLGTAALPAKDLLLVLPFPFIVWGADELRRWLVRRSETRPGSPPHRGDLDRIRESADRGSAAGRFDEATRRLDLGSDRAGGEARAAELGRRSRAQSAIRIGPPVEVNRVDVGEQEQKIGVEATRQQGSGQILVDHRLDAAHRSGAVERDRDPAALRRR